MKGASNDKGSVRVETLQALLLGRIRDGLPVKRVVDDMLDELKELLALDNNDTRQLISRADEGRSGELGVGYLHYVEERRSAWTLNPEVVDQVNELLLVCRRKRHVAIYLSDTSWRSAIAKRFDKMGAKGLGILQKIEPGLLNAAFVKGAARTLWLSGTHARTSIKADNKILSGIELQDALDPLGDQTYYFTAARCASDFDPSILAVGTSPRGSRIWVGTSSRWEEFEKAVTVILRHLERTKEPNATPIPVVAVSAVDTSYLADAFDLAVVPPELLSDDPSIDEQTREEMEEWAYYTSFKIVESTGADLTAEVVLKGNPLGTIQFQMNLSEPDNIKWTLKDSPASEATREDLARVTSACHRPSWIKIWYESGHTISDAAIFEVRHRNMPFQDYVWVDFSNHDQSKSFAKYDVCKEKPSSLDLKTIGNEDSLFCWVQNLWPFAAFGSARGGWLACDDGAMEIADFIHLDDEGDPPKLSLIHVKASDDPNPSRGVSVSKYEVVTSQAVKNLRSLDRAVLAEGLHAGLKKAVGSLVWHNRQPTKTGRKGMLAALDKIGASYERQVVIIQPRLTKARALSARKNPTGQDAARLRQLDTLMIAQANSCHGLQARLRVLCADEPEAQLPVARKRRK